MSDGGYDPPLSGIQDWIWAAVHDRRHHLCGGRHDGDGSDKAVRAPTGPGRGIRSFGYDFDGDGIPDILAGRGSLIEFSSGGEYDLGEELCFDEGDGAPVPVR